MSFKPSPWMSAAGAESGRRAAEENEALRRDEREALPSLVLGTIVLVICGGLLVYFMAADVACRFGGHC